MAGNFARGFMSTFGPTVQATANRRDDMFKTFYKQFTDKQEAYQANQVKDAKITNQAKLLAQDLGLPEGAWDWVRKRLADGYSLEQVKEAAERQKFGPTDMAPGQTNEAAPSAMETQEQMRQAGLSMPAPPDASVSPSQPRTGGIPQAIVAGVERMKKGFQDRDMDLMMKRMEQTTGLPREQIEIIMAQNPAAITPMGDPSKQQTQTAQTYTVEPKVLTTKYTPEEFQAADDIIKSREKEYTKLTNRATLAKAAVSDATDMVNIVKDPEVGEAILADFTVRGAQFIAGMSQEAGQVLNVFFGKESEAIKLRNQIAKEEANGNRASPELYKAAESALQKEMSAFENSDVGGRISKVAQLGTLFQMKKQFLAYKLAGMYDQEGRNLAQVEFEMFNQIAAGGNSREKFFQNFSVLINRELGRLEDERQQFMANPRIKNWEDMTDKPFPSVYSTQTIQEYVTSTPENKETMTFLEDYNSLNDEVTEKKTDQNSPQTKIPEGYTFVEKTDKGQTVVRDASGNQFVLGE